MKSNRLNNVLKGCNTVIDYVIIVLLLAIIVFSIWGMYVPAKTYFTPDVSKEILEIKPVEDNTSNEAEFNELRETYPDIIAWLTIGGTNIDYPVVQGTDNDKYLYYDANGSSSIAGAIFMDYRNQKDFSDFYSLLYGHHMSHEKMFGHVTDFLDTEFFKENTTGELFLPDGDYTIYFFACVKTTAYDELIYSPHELNNDEDKNNFLSYIKQNAVQYRDLQVSPDDKIIGLSTCYSVITDGRAVLFGVLTKNDSNIEN